jgi:hypothetical protein
VAVVYGKIVASTDTRAVIEEATRNVPGVTWQDIVLISMPSSLNVLYLS